MAVMADLAVATQAIIIMAEIFAVPALQMEELMGQPVQMPEQELKVAGAEPEVQKQDGEVLEVMEVMGAEALPEEIGALQGLPEIVNVPGIPLLAQFAALAETMEAMVEMERMAQAHHPEQFGTRQQILMMARWVMQEVTGNTLPPEYKPLPPAMDKVAQAVAVVVAVAVRGDRLLRCCMMALAVQAVAGVVAVRAELAARAALAVDLQ